LCKTSSIPNLKYSFFNFLGGKIDYGQIPWFRFIIPISFLKNPKKSQGVDFLKLIEKNQFRIKKDF
jgi:hypothetical protein